MSERLILPLFLFAALMLGGSVQGPLHVLVLELFALGILGWSYARPAKPSSHAARQLRRLSWAAVVIVAVQLIPLPPALWHALPGREMIAAGDRLMGTVDSWRPLSLVPESTLAALMMFVVPLAIVAAGTRLPSAPRTAIAGSIIVAATVGALWGLAQQSGRAPHPYPFSSTGPTGPFANTNHLATLAVAALPFAAALVAELERRRKTTAWRAMGALLAALLTLTTMMTGSLAMILLLAPVLILSAIIAVRPVPKSRRAAVIGLTVGALLLVVLLGAGLTAGDASISASTRGEIWRRTLSLSPLMVTGGGYGAFPSLYALVEDPFRVDNFFVNHAHNELIELALEGGILALALTALFVGWWGRAAVAAWRPGVEGDPFARAGAVGAAVLFLHSLVDFPMRTEAHLALMAACLLLLASSAPPKPVVDGRDLRPTRHRRVDGSARADNRR